MTLTRRTGVVRTLVVGLVIALPMAFGPGVTAHAGPDDTAAPAPPAAAGIQAGAKGQVDATTTGGQLNPYLSEPIDQQTDYTGWRRRLAAQGRQRAKSTPLAKARLAAGVDATSATKAVPPAVHDEEEPLGAYGSNDDQASAEPIVGFGTGRGQNPRVRVLGNIATPDDPDPVDLPVADEDNGSIPLATPTGIEGTGAILTTGTLGDGPHGAPPGDGSNDYDVYSLVVDAGATIRFSTIGSSVDTVIALYDEAGQMVASDDDGGFGLSSLLSYRAPTAGTYYALLAAFNGRGVNPFPTDPNDSGSGLGGARTGKYRLDLSARYLDTDVYAVDLAAGDVLGVSVTGTATTIGGSAQVYRPDGTAMVKAFTGLDDSALYPVESPLPGGGDVVLAYVAEQAGTYAVALDGSPGDYSATVEVYRPGLQLDTTSAAQTIFLDFDGARLSTIPFDPMNGGIKTLSPMSAFLAKWGIPRADEATLIDKITDGVRENLRRDVIASGLNPRVGIRVTNSKDSVDLFGRDNVSRVVVGGTVAQTGLATVGIATGIDPGNFAHQDWAIVQLDALSASPASAISPASSLNTYLTPQSDRLDFVARALSNVISHEVGHLLGNFHTDNGDDVPSLMDTGGNGQAVFFGVGPDGIGGTADDTDTDFVADAYQPSEVFAGQENTMAVVAAALTRSRNLGG